MAVTALMLPPDAGVMVAFMLPDLPDLDILPSNYYIWVAGASLTSFSKILHQSNLFLTI
jgi:hypothetical protein